MKYLIALSVSLTFVVLALCEDQRYDGDSALTDAFSVARKFDIRYNSSASGGAWHPYHRQNNGTGTGTVPKNQETPEHDPQEDIIHIHGFLSDGFDVPRWKWQALYNLYHKWREIELTRCQEHEAPADVNYGGWWSELSGPQRFDVEFKFQEYWDHEDHFGPPCR